MAVPGGPCLKGISVEGSSLDNVSVGTGGGQLSPADCDPGGPGWQGIVKIGSNMCLPRATQACILLGPNWSPMEERRWSWG